MTGTIGRPVAVATKRAVTVNLPPSKSYTNRALIAAALADGESRILNASTSLDTRLLVRALGQFGVTITPSGPDLIVRGSGGRFERADRELYLGNAGTAVRFLTALAAIAPGETLLRGDSSMDTRPMGELLDALARSGVVVSSRDGHLPVRVNGGSLSGGKITIDAGRSSQFLSALLLVAPYASSPVEIALLRPSASVPYVGMTLSVMEAFGVSVEHGAGAFSTVRSVYSPATFEVEPDVSGSIFFAVAAAVTASEVTIQGVSRETLQGDLAAYPCLERMGCRTEFGQAGVKVTGPARLGGIRADLNDAPDSVPPLAVAAAFATGDSILSNVVHLRYKETDRLGALAAELPKIGASVSLTSDGLRITPGVRRPALIETYNDHRIAMSFAVAGLNIAGMRIADPRCVDKSFPGFWDELDKFH